jgi:hypothetical protein
MIGKSSWRISICKSRNLQLYLCDLQVVHFVFIFVFLIQKSDYFIVWITVFRLKTLRGKSHGNNVFGNICTNTRRWWKLILFSVIETFFVLTW